MSGQSALTCLETWVRLVDDVNTALTANNAAIAVTRLKGAKRILDFHSLSPISGAVIAPGLSWSPSPHKREMVGITGIEPVTPSMSTKCSPAELYTRKATSAAEATLM